MAVGPYALTTLQAVKDWIGETSSTYDTTLERLIDATTARIERYIGRQIVARDRVEFHDGNVDELRLKAYPIISCKYIGYGRETAMVVTSSDTTDLAATVHVTPANTMVLVRTSSNGTETTITEAFATHKSAGTLATQVESETGWAATALSDCPSKYFHRMGPVDARQSQAIITAPSQRSTTYRMDCDAGLIRFPIGWNADDWNECEEEWQCSGDAQTVVVDYNAGYATVPDDIADACIQIVAQVYRSRFKDANINSESLGDYSYTSAVRDAGEDMLDGLLGTWKEIR